MKPFLFKKSLIILTYGYDRCIPKKINDAFKFLRFQVPGKKKSPKNAFTCLSVLKQVHKFVLYIFLQFNCTHHKYFSLR